MIKEIIGVAALLIIFSIVLAGCATEELTLQDECTAERVGKVISATEFCHCTCEQVTEDFYNWQCNEPACIEPQEAVCDSNNVGESKIERIDAYKSNNCICNEEGWICTEEYDSQIPEWNDQK